MERLFNEGMSEVGLPKEDLTTLIWIAVIFVVFSMILGLVVAVARYVAETAVIRMVDEYENTGTKMTVRQGFRIGWSRTSWRLFLINLLVNLPLILGMCCSFGVGIVVFRACHTGQSKKPATFSHCRFDRHHVPGHLCGGDCQHLPGIAAALLLARLCVGEPRRARIAEPRIPDGARELEECRHHVAGDDRAGNCLGDCFHHCLHRDHPRGFGHGCGWRPRGGHPCSARGRTDQPLPQRLVTVGRRRDLRAAAVLHDCLLALAAAWQLADGLRLHRVDTGLP